MSQSVVVLFLLALVGINTINGQGDCYDGLGTCINDDQNSVANGSQCSTVFIDHPECPKIHKKKPENQMCCVDCDNLNDVCEEFVNSVARGPTNVGPFPILPFELRSPCCPSELVIFSPFVDSKCNCCIDCKPRRRCRNHRGKKSRCVTEFDPIYNFNWCDNEVQGKRIPDLCKAEGCECCYDYKPE